MCHSHLKLAWRNLSRQKLHSLVSIGGLAVGMAVCIIILLFVDFELSYDDFHARADRLCRVRLDGYREGVQILGRAKVFGFIGPELKEAYPEVSEQARLINLQGIMGNLVMSRGAVSFVEEKMYYADPAFLRMFSFSLREGDPDLALAEPRTAVLTESTARKYFGDESALGKTLVMNGREDYLVTGILEDVPPNSHLKFDFLLSFATIRSEKYMLGWADFFTYLLLDPGVEPVRFNAKLEESDILAGRFGEERPGETYRLALQSLRDIHLRSHLEAEAEANGSAATTYGLLVVALFVLVIAWINHVNLSISRSLDRAREVGVRKVVGARRSDLIKQFLLESCLINLIAALVSLLLVSLVLPIFGSLAGDSLSIAAPRNLGLWAILLGFLLLGGWLASVYPALLMSAFHPRRVLRVVSQSPGKALGPRRFLIVFQFSAAVVLIIGAWAVFRQVSFMRRQELGIDIDRTLIVKAPSLTDKTFEARFDVFKTGLLGQPDIRSITVSSNIPGRESTWGGSISPEGNPAKGVGNVDFVGIDFDFIEAYGLSLSAGRNFSPEFPSDKEAVLLNVEAVTRLGIPNPEEALGRRFVTWREAVSRVVGVVNDHHQLSLRHGQIPTVYFLRPRGDFYSLKLSAQRLAGTIAAVEREYKRFFPGNPFDHFFLDDYFDRQYRADQRFGRVFGSFAGLAFLTACLGLFALAAYTAGRRIREIGIRKVLGASLWQLLALLSRDFLGLILIAVGISLPLAAFGIQKWLQNYAYRMKVGWDIFILPPLLVIVFALAIVVFQTLKAALVDPVESLRYE